MGSFDHDIKMSVDEFRMIRDFIHEKSGIFFAENKMYLIQNRLGRRMAELDMKTVRDYFYHVKYDVSLKEFNQLMDLITTNETSFFRNEPQLTTFAEEILPLLIEQKTQARGLKTLKLWSAGCSTGEEPYTLAMLILDRLQSTVGWSIEIVASDISEQVLQVARKGEYSGLTLRNVRPDVLNRHFERFEDKYRIRPAVKQLVKFTHMNLNDERKISLMRGLDVVFCRNVMIYFSNEVKKQLVRNFYNVLNPGGYFFIGHSETLHAVSKAFKLVYFKNALVYQKEAATGGKTVSPAVRSAAVMPRRTAAAASATEPAASGAARALDLLKQIKGNATERQKVNS